MRKLIVVGYGAGPLSGMTGACRACLEQADIIIGYEGYIDILRSLFPQKTFMATPMRGEMERCQTALALAQQGNTVCMACGGDSGVYGMAGLVYELSPAYPSVEISVVPGVTAACEAAAALGAPIGHDFAVISLSDLLTPWSVIEKRLHAAAQADFVLCLYNPGSRKRTDTLRRACDILLTCRPDDLVCGMVRDAGREGQTLGVLTLGQLRDTQVDMFTIVIIGNSETRVIDGKMVTPRGYPHD